MTWLILGIMAVGIIIALLSRSNGGQGGDNVWKNQEMSEPKVEYESPDKPKEDQDDPEPSDRLDYWSEQHSDGTDSG